MSGSWRVINLVLVWQVVVPAERRSGLHLLLCVPSCHAGLVATLASPWLCVTSLPGRVALAAGSWLSPPARAPAPGLTGPRSLRDTAFTSCHLPHHATCDERLLMNCQLPVIGPPSTAHSLQSPVKQFNRSHSNLSTSNRLTRIQDSILDCSITSSSLLDMTFNRINHFSYQSEDSWR